MFFVAYCIAKSLLQNSVWFSTNQISIVFLGMAVFILEDALSVSTNLGKHSLFVWLFVSNVKTVTRRIIRLDELSSVVRRSSRTTEEKTDNASCARLYTRDE